MKLFSKQIDKRIAAYQRELIETHYVEVGNMYKQIRGWRHDYRNHIQVMKAHAASGDMVAVKKYLDELEMDLATVDTVIKTGNPMADAILNSKISLAKSKNVPVKVDVFIPLALKTSELELYGYEEHPALYLLYQLHRFKKEKEAKRKISNHQRRRPWFWLDSNGYHY